MAVGTCVVPVRTEARFNYPPSSQSATPNGDRFNKIGAAMLVTEWVFIICTVGSRENGIAGTCTRAKTPAGAARDPCNDAVRDATQMLPSVRARTRLIGFDRPRNARFAPRCASAVLLPSLRATAGIIMVCRCSELADCCF